MTTYETEPTFTDVLAIKFAKVMRKRRNRQSNTANLTSVRSFFTATLRLLMHLAGFGCLTWAGFEWTMRAGLIIAGLSFFTMSWLMLGNTTNSQPDERGRR